MKKMSVIKVFWKTAKSFLSDKMVSKEQILLVENDEIISEDCRITELFLLRHCKIPEYKPRKDSLFENVSNLILNVVLRYRNHPNLLTIGAAF